MALYAPLFDLSAVSKTESATVEFKARYTKAGSPPRFDHYEMAKDAAAFANALGGTIIVGADEDQVTHIIRGWVPLTIPETQDIRIAFSQAVRDRCSPVPVIDPHAVRNPAGTGEAIIVNIEPFPTQAIGARVDSHHDAVVFPLRSGVDTIFLLPEQLPMYLDAAARRSAIQLSRIPNRQINLFFESMTADDSPLPFNILDIDLQSSTATLIYSSSTGRPVNVPLSAISRIWKDLGDNRWLGSLVGRICETNTGHVYRPSPHGGSRRNSI